MAAISTPSPLARLRAWRTTRRKSSADLLALGAVTVAAFVLLLVGFDALGGTAMVTRAFSGTLSARSTADYSGTFGVRVKPLRPNGAGPTDSPGR